MKSIKLNQPSQKSPAPKEQSSSKYSDKLLASLGISRYISPHKKQNSGTFTAATKFGKIAHELDSLTSVVISKLAKKGHTKTRSVAQVSSPLVKCGFLKGKLVDPLTLQIEVNFVRRTMIRLESIY